MSFEIALNFFEKDLIGGHLDKWLIANSMAPGELPPINKQSYFRNLYASNNI